MLCVPTASELVLNVAEPADTATVASVVAPSLKATVPVSVPAPGATIDTVAVKVTDCPNTDGFALEAKLVVVLAWLTTCDRAALVLVLKLVSPLYTAVMLCVPTASALVLNVAVVTPAVVETVPVPMLVAPSLKSTVPVGKAAAVVPGAVTLIVAVKVTFWPNTDGFWLEVSAVVVLAAFTTWLTVLLVLALKLVSPA